MGSPDATTLSTPPAARTAGPVALLLAAAASASAAAWLVAATEALSQGSSWLRVSGLLQVLALFVGLLIGLLVVVLSGDDLVALPRLFQSPAHRARLLLAGPLVLLCWMVLGPLALNLLVAFDEQAVRGGPLLALLTVGALTAGTYGGQLAADQLARRIKIPSFAVCLAVAIFVPLLGSLSLVFFGQTSGTGPFPGLFGVLRRPELNLVPVWQLLVIALLAGLGAWALRRRLTTRFAWVLGGAASLPAAVAVIAAAGLGPRAAVNIERGDGLSSRLLRVHASLFDADGDGVPTAFGGNDCRDDDPDIRPGAVDKPGNGIDEDCSGADAAVTAPALPAALPKEAGEEAHALPDRPNVLLLSVDTLRWDLGYARPDAPAGLSPNLDRLAARSTVYERAYALASYTSKSLGPMLVGRYPSETQRTFEHFDRFSSAVPFLQERLQDAGIRTVSVQGYWYFFFDSYGFERGWDVLNKEAAPRNVVIEGDKTSNGDELADQAIAELTAQDAREGQFFMWTHWVDPHSEYVAHEAHDFGDEPRQRYDGEVAFVDQQLGRVLDHLETLSFADRTIVIVTSDHGEAFGEHGMIRHGFEVWEELVRVPLIVHVPGAPHHEISARRSLIDVAPTILQVFEVTPEAEAFIRGHSLLPEVLAPQGMAAPPERPVLVDMPKGPHNRERQAFYEGKYKVITHEGQVIGVYDLERDPGEKQDLADDQQLVEKLKQARNQFLGRLEPIEAQ